MIPAAPPLPPLDQPLTGRRERQARAQALSDIAFDASAELEYRAAYAATHSPKFLLDAAGAAIAAGHYGAGMAAVRQAFPQLEARRVAEIPNEAWRAAFPLPYESSLRSEAARNQFDPMLVAGLIRQESAFESKAMSRAGRGGIDAGDAEDRAQTGAPDESAICARAADRSGLQFAARFALSGRSDPVLRNAGSGSGSL